VSEPLTVPVNVPVDCDLPCSGSVPLDQGLGMGCTVKAKLWPWMCYRLTILKKVTRFWTLPYYTLLQCAVLHSTVPLSYSFFGHEPQSLARYTQQPGCTGGLPRPHWGWGVPGPDQTALGLGCTGA